MTNEQWAVIEQLRDAGYAVIVWTPEELRDAPMEYVEDACIMAGWNAIHDSTGE